MPIMTTAGKKKEEVVMLFISTTHRHCFRHRYTIIAQNL